jgi:hypothetical protein
MAVLPLKSGYSRNQIPSPEGPIEGPDLGSEPSVKIPILWPEALRTRLSRTESQKRGSNFGVYAADLSIRAGSRRLGQTVWWLLCRAVVGRGPQKRRAAGCGDRAGAHCGATSVSAASGAARRPGPIRRF